MITVAVAGVGAIGSTVCRALIDGIDGLSLVAAASLDPDYSRKLIDRPDFDLDFVDLHKISVRADWVIEALPLVEIPVLTRQVMEAGKTLILISSAALLVHPELMALAKENNSGRILVPSGALAGMDAVNALAEQGIKSVKLTTTKPPQAYAGAPYIQQNNIDLQVIDSARIIFTGNALDAAAGFPANINVAATLALASRLAPEEVKVEICANPAIKANRHDVTVKGKFSTMHFTLENIPDPSNPKSSTLAALSVISHLRRQTASLWIG